LRQIQVANTERDDIASVGLQGNGFRYFHGPLENFGVFNGQIEQGPPGQDEAEAPEGWVLSDPWAEGGTFLRMAGGYAGNWCVRGCNAGAGRGVRLVSSKYIPVAQSAYDNYYIQGAFYQTNNGQAYLGVECYSAAKAILGTASPLGLFVPGAAWVKYWGILGPVGTAFWANTRYVRVRVELQNDVAINNGCVWGDDFKFQQIQSWAYQFFQQP